MSGQLTSHMQGATLVLTLSNPGLRNALSPEMYAAAVEALSVASGSEAVKTVVFAGQDGHFCAGGQLQRLQHNRAQPPDIQAASIDQLHSWIDAILTFPKPVLAAVEGSAAGAGMSLALTCDLVVAADDAVFAASYSNIGLSPDGGLTWQLGRALPRQLANEWVMGGEKLPAQRLHQHGLVNRLAKPGEALADALAWALVLNQRADNALASAKELIQSAASNTLHAQLDTEKTHFVRNLQHRNTGEGIAAFLAKRKPRFGG